MIEKIIEIKNIGRFIDYKLKSSNQWNGELKQINLIYAPNGSGKTTLATIFKSLKTENGSLIEIKKSSITDDESIVRLKSNHIIEYKNKYWSDIISNIEVFDIHFIEDYLFVGSTLKKQNKVNLYKLILGQKGIEFKNECKTLISKKESLLKRVNSAINEENKLALNVRLTQAQKELDTALNEYYSYSNGIFEEHIKFVNKYLSRFSPYIKLTEFSYQKRKGLSDFEIFRIYIVFEIHGRQVHFNAPDLARKIPNAKYMMSEGDKSAVAFCFFLARLEILGYNDKIIVFDDPLSSFDYGRKTTTIFNLAKIAHNCQQFFLLTHDIHFAKEFNDKLDFNDVLNLKISDNGLSSIITFHDIHNETFSGLQKDLQTVKNYLSNGVISEAERREVIRCVRPILEGIIKTKYFDVLDNNCWLGDIISIINKSTTRLSNLKPIYTDLIELNDFTKAYHHSDSGIQNDLINDQELKTYINLLMQVIEKI